MIHYDDEQNKESNLTWKLVDDGTGRNKLYVSNIGTKTRHRPEDFSDSGIERLSNGEIKYYWRGTCVRCRLPFSPCVLRKGIYEDAYSFNLCERCLKTTTVGIKNIRKNGDKVWDANLGQPLICYVPIKERALNPHRERVIFERSIEAKFAVLKGRKHRRDLECESSCRIRAKPYHINNGTYLSWGIGKEYDEFLGEVNEAGKPHGAGIKFFSDGAIYIGNFFDGYLHTSQIGTLISADGSQYEGNWVHGKRHGKGEQRYKDGTIYVGQFAQGVEHGHGERTEANGVRFEGRFRFGRRDGPGTLYMPGLKPHKETFKDKQLDYSFHAPAKVQEDEIEDESFYNPPSLLQIALENLVNIMSIAGTRRRCVFPLLKLKMEHIPLLDFKSSHFNTLHLFHL